MTGARARIRRELGLDAAAASRHAALLASVPGVAAPVAVDGASAEYAVVPGLSLAEVCAVRPLTIAECAFVGARVAEILASLHAAGAVHADISPGNVMVDGARVTLVDAMAGAGEGGTAPCAAPEGPGSPAADVYALGAVLRLCADNVAAATIEAWTAALLDPAPDRRPSAAQVAAGLPRLERGTPVARRQLPVAAAARVGATVTRTVRTPQGRAWRLERWAVRALPGLVALVVVGVALAPALASPTPVPTAVAVAPVIPAAALPPDRAATELTRALVSALAAGDARRAAEVAIPGSPAHAAVLAAPAGGGAEAGEITARLVDRSGTTAVVDVEYEVGEQARAARLALGWTVSGWKAVRILPRP